MESLLKQWIKPIIKSLGNKRTIIKKTNINEYTGVKTDLLITQFERGQVCEYYHYEQFPIIETVILFTYVGASRATQIKYKMYTNNPGKPFDLSISDPEGSLFRIFYKEGEE